MQVDFQLPIDIGNVTSHNCELDSNKNTYAYILRSILVQNIAIVQSELGNVMLQTRHRMLTQFEL